MTSTPLAVIERQEGMVELGLPCARTPRARESSPVEAPTKNRRLSASQVACAFLI